MWLTSRRPTTGVRYLDRGRARRDVRSWRRSSGIRRHGRCDGLFPWRRRSRAAGVAKLVICLYLTLLFSVYFCCFHCHKTELDIIAFIYFFVSIVIELNLTLLLSVIFDRIEPVICFQLSVISLWVILPLLAYCRMYSMMVCLKHQK